VFQVQLRQILAQFRAQGQVVAVLEQITDGLPHAILSFGT
jgi:hypothetical protein